MRVRRSSAVAGMPATFDFWVEDDALYASGSNAPISGKQPMVEIVVAKYRGPGKVTVGKGHKTITTLKGGKPAEPFAGKTSTTVTFSEPGEYVVHVTAMDYSGEGGGGEMCCWTTAMMKVAVAP